MQKVFDHTELQLALIAIGDKKDREIRIYYAPDDEECFYYANGLQLGLTKNGYKKVRTIEKAHDTELYGNIFFHPTDNVYIAII